MSVNITFVILGIVDLLSALLIFFPFSEAVMLYIMVWMAAKGGFFLATGLASRSMGPHCISLCISDILVAIALGTITLGFGSLGAAGTVGTFLKTVGIIGLIKGLYTTALPLLS